MRLVSRDLPRMLALCPDFRVAINLTASDLKTAETTERLEDLLACSGSSPRNVVLEATEHGFMNGPDCREVISALRRRGFLVAIHDFGTCYSSSSCLQQLDLDLLKVDKAFVETIGTDGATSGVVLHIIEIARSLNLHLVAEGVETEAPAMFLLDHGVEYAQGWLFGRPMGIDALLQAAGQRRSSDATASVYSRDAYLGPAAVS